MSVPTSTGTVFITIHADREAWLQAAIQALRPKFAEAGHPLPETVRVSVGFGLTLRGENKSILGQAFRPETTEDGVSNIFVSPVIDTATDALGVLAHELCHVSDYADKGEGGHGRAFTKIGKAIGLDTEKPSQALPGVALEAELVALAEVLGGYPHVKIEIGTKTVTVPTEGGGTRTVRAHTGPAKQEARNLKLICAHGGPQHVRMSRGQAETVGMPYCSCHVQPMIWA